MQHRVLKRKYCIAHKSHKTFSILNFNGVTKQKPFFLRTRKGDYRKLITVERKKADIFHSTAGKASADDA